MEEKTVKKENVTPGKEPLPDSEDWYKHIGEEEHKTHERLEKTAQFLSSMIAISLTVFLTVTRSGDTLMACWAVKVALLAWLSSLILAFLVLFPFRYRFIEGSVKSIKLAHAPIVRAKWVLLIISSSLFFGALCILVALLL